MQSVDLSRSLFGTTPDGEPIHCWTLGSASGVRAQVLTLGGILHSLRVPDADGHPGEVVRGLAGAADYQRPNPYVGALIGRYANRIAGGRFTLDGRTYQVPATDRGHALHGGPDGFHRRLWTARPGPAVQGGPVRLTLELHSPDGDMGFPGALDVTVVHSLDPAGTLAVDYRARTDRPTVLNLTHHAYFNLAGAARDDVLGHVLTLDADRYLPVSPEAIPLDGPVPTAGTPFDFSRPRALGERIADDDPQLTAAGGYDHCWVLTPPENPTGDPAAPRRAAVLEDPGSGRRLEVWTTEPGIQVYTGNGLDGSLTGPDGRPHGRHSAVCLETQHYPDAPNRPAYPTTLLRPGESFHSRTEFRFPRRGA